MSEKKDYVTHDELLALFAILALAAAAYFVLNQTFLAGQYSGICKLDGGTPYTWTLPDNQPRGDFYCAKDGKVITHYAKELG